MPVAVDDRMMMRRRRMAGDKSKKDKEVQ